MDDIERLKREAFEGDSDAQGALLRWAERAGDEEWIKIATLLMQYIEERRADEESALRLERLGLACLREEAATEIDRIKALPGYRMAKRVLDLWSMIVGATVASFAGVLFMGWPTSAQGFAYAVLCLGALTAYRRDVAKIMLGKQHLRTALDLTTPKTRE